MDYFDFLNSKTIRQHLEGINYQLSAPEAAFIVYESQLTTLEDKISAWQTITETMPDCSMGERVNMIAIESVHAFLKEYIALLRKQITRFHQEEPAVYSYSIRFLDNDSLEEFDELFPDFDMCISHCKKHWPNEGIKRFTFRKRFFSSAEDSGKELRLEMNDAFEIMDVNCSAVLNDHESDIDLVFDGMWFDFPTPFKRGDIVISSASNPQCPCVLDHIFTWDNKTMLENGCSPVLCRQADTRLERIRQRGDISDMGFFAYYVDGANLLSEIFLNYLDLERYTGPLEGKHRILKVASYTMHHGGNYELLLTACNYLSKDTECRELRKFLKSGLSGDVLKEFGIED